MPAAQTPVQTPEIDQVQRWRTERLERAGYPASSAAELASRHDIDLHQAISLVESGCPVDIALRILI